MAFCRGYLPSAEISIPALREEGDLHIKSQQERELYFYPRPPRGGRRRVQPMRAAPRQFLSPPSARRATKFVCLLVQGVQFLSPPSARRATALLVVSRTI